MNQFLYQFIPMNHFIYHLMSTPIYNLYQIPVYRSNCINSSIQISLNQFHSLNQFISKPFFRSIFVCSSFQINLYGCLSSWEVPRITLARQVPRSCSFAYARILRSMFPQQVLHKELSDIGSHLKGLVKQDPSRSKSLF